MKQVIFDVDVLRSALTEFRAKRFHDGMVMLGAEKCTRCWGTTFRTNVEKTPHVDGKANIYGGNHPTYVPCECFEGWVVPTTGVKETIVGANVVDPPNPADEEDYLEDDWGDPGHCPECGQAWEHVRPGKSQPTCRCSEKCPCGGTIRYHSPENSPIPRVSGYFCDTCGPFGQEAK